MLLQQVDIVARLEAVISDAIMSVGCEDGLIVAEKGERVDSDAVPIVDNCALQITHVELSANARGDEARSIG